MPKARPARRRGRPKQVRVPVPRRPEAAHAAPTFDAIVTAAERLLGREGAAALTTNRVAELAGVSIGTVYDYFPNKYAIVAALFERNVTRIDRIFRDALDRASSIGEALGLLVAGLRTMLEAQPTIHHELWQLRTAAGVHAHIARLHAGMIDAATAALERWGLARGDEARALAFTLVHAGDGVANAVANARGAVSHEQIALAFARLVRGLG